MIRNLIWRARRAFICFTTPQLTVASDAKIGKGTFISRKAPIVIGSRFYCGPNCYISAKLSIGNRVMLGGHVAVVGGDHDIDSGHTNIIDAGRAELKQTTICDDVWIGHGVVILQGVNLGKGCVVGAGSVVTRDIPENAVTVGNPAKVVRFRNFSE